MNMKEGGYKMSEITFEDIQKANETINTTNIKR